MLCLLPDAVPGRGPVQRWARERWANSGPAPTAGAMESSGLQLILTEALSRISSSTWLGTRHGEAGDDAHDAYFRVQRVDAEPPPAFVRMLLAARLLLLQEAATNAAEHTQPFLQAMDQSLADLLAALIPADRRLSAVVSDWEFSRTPQHLPLHRWIAGHQLFAALTQGLILSFSALGNAIRTGDHAEARRWAEGATTLLHGSAAAFAFTGDFAPEEYEQWIRPTMAPPFTAVSLSGLMSADHRALAQQMRDMRPAFRALADREPDLHHAMAHALAVVYDQHILVCQRFVGSQPSLLVAGKTEKPGPQVIQQFKALRQKAFEYQPKLGRLAPTPPRCPMSEQIRKTFYAGSTINQH